MPSPLESIMTTDNRSCTKLVWDEASVNTFKSNLCVFLNDIEPMIGDSEEVNVNYFVETITSCLVNAAEFMQRYIPR